MLEGMVSGLCAAAFNGTLSSLVCPPGIFIPIIMTNAKLDSFVDYFSNDRIKFYEVTQEKVSSFGQGLSNRTDIISMLPDHKVN